jgi:photosystem II stability/assembly factor-like uncharacterized protein
MNKISLNITRLFFCFLFFTGTEISYAQWIVENSNTDSDLNAISLRNDNSGWIVGNNGTILKKTTSGWQKIKSPVTDNLYSLFIVNDDDVWAVGARGRIIHFDGKEWKNYDSPSRSNLYSVSFTDSENGLAVGDYGTVLTFRKGIWRLRGNPTRGKLLAVSCRAGENWIGGGLECVKIPIMRLGEEAKGNGVKAAFDSHINVNSITFLSADNGWAVGSPGTILHFDGEKWTKIGISIDFPSLNSVFFQDVNNGLSVGCAGTILCYKDYLWTKEKSPVSQNLNGCCSTGKVYYAVGNKGSIIKRSTEEKNMTGASGEQVGESIRIYPDPCNDVLNIIIQNETSVTGRQISISNTSGQIVFQKDLGEHAFSGEYSIPTSELKEGYYLLRIVSGEKSSTLKFIVQH